MADKLVDYAALGGRIQQRRQQLGLSQQAAAEKVNLSTSFFSRVERGEKVASLETLIKIADNFGFSLDYLLQDSLDKSMPDKIQAELAQIFNDKTAEQKKRLVSWLKMLSENIDELG
jgi:transcriptional regulator with XRE-family HTH domain